MGQRTWCRAAGGSKAEVVPARQGRDRSGEERRASTPAQFIWKTSPMFSLSPLKPPFLA